MSKKRNKGITLLEALKPADKPNLNESNSEVPLEVVHIPEFVDRHLDKTKIKAALLLDMNADEKSIQEKIGNVKLINLFTMVSSLDSKYIKRGDCFLLACIEKIRETSLLNKDINVLMSEFKEICHQWFLELESFDIIAIVAKKVHYADRFSISELISWLYGYYVVGKQVKWYLSDGTTVCDNDLVITEREEDDAIKLDYQSYLSELSINDDYKLIIDSNQRYILAGYINYQTNSNKDLIDKNWYSDNISFESQIAGNFGSFNKELYNTTLKDIVFKCNGYTQGGDLLLRKYEEYILNYYKDLYGEL